MMDRDYPMTPGQLRTTVIALAAAGLVGLALFGGYLPGLKPDYSNLGIADVNGHEYYWRVIEVPAPLPGGPNYTAPEPIAVENVTFWIWVTDWYSLAGGHLHGNASASNGTEYPFVLVGGGLPGTQVTQYFSPDAEVGAGWTGGSTANLFVLR